MRLVLRWMGSAILASSMIMLGCSKPQMPLAKTPPAEVTVAPVLVIPKLTLYDEYPGKIAAIYSIDIQARVDGYITKVGFKDGEEVKEDQLLFEIDPRPYKARFDISSARIKSVEAQLKFNDIEVKRNTGLLNSGSGNAVSREELERSVSKRDEALAGIGEAKADLEEKKLYLDWTQVRAPKPGRLSRRYVEVGNLVSGSPMSGTLLTTLVSVDPMYVYFDVDERSVQHYRQLVSEGKLGNVRKSNQHIEEANLPVFVGLSTEKGFPHVGTLDFVDNKVNPATGTLVVRGVLPNPNRVLQPGYFARVLVLGGTVDNAVLITERALGTRQDERFVLVVNAEGKVESRSVELGRLVQGLRQITSGLKGDEKIIIDGIQRVLGGDTVKFQEVAMPTPQGFDMKKLYVDASAMPETVPMPMPENPKSNEPMKETPKTEETPTPKSDTPSKQ